MLGILNYGMGNLASVQNALDHLQIPNRIVSEPGEIRDCDRVIIPGVGAFGEAMEKIRALGFEAELREFALAKERPVLGICLGMQLLLDSSVEHGLHRGLGLAPGEVRHLGEVVTELPVPHIGWNTVRAPAGSRLLAGIEPQQANFYFVHSYYCALAGRDQVIGSTSYGVDFDVLCECGNVFGVQFHPEKSQKSGLNLLKNFGKV